MLPVGGLVIVEHQLVVDGFCVKEKRQASDEKEGEPPALERHPDILPDGRCVANDEGYAADAQLEGCSARAERWYAEMRQTMTIQMRTSAMLSPAKAAMP